MFPLDDIQFDECLNYVERPIAILDRMTKALRNKEVTLVTWEPEEKICEHYPR